MSPGRPPSQAGGFRLGIARPVVDRSREFSQWSRRARASRTEVVLPYSKGKCTAGALKGLGNGKDGTKGMEWKRV